MKPLREGMPAAPVAEFHAVGVEQGAAFGELIDSVCPGDRWVPMLDWTSRGMARLLPGRTLFRPVDPDAAVLPYLDHTIEAVLVDSAERMDEAARVTAGTVILVSLDDDGEPTGVNTLDIRCEPPPPPPPVLILVNTDAQDEWLGRVSQATAGRPGCEVRPAAGGLAEALEADAATVVLAERGVLPLPPCIEAAERLLASDPQVGGVAVKLLDADGVLEAAGGAAFADGSIAGIAEGAPAAAPWHEYVRPVAAAVGLVVMRPAAARQCAGAVAGRLDLAAVSAHIWSSGWKLLYQPDAVATRESAPAPAEPAIWPLATDALPARPGRLDRRAWRDLLSRRELGAVR